VKTNPNIPHHFQKKHQKTNRKEGRARWNLLPIRLKNTGQQKRSNIKKAKFYEMNLAFFESEIF
jgi:hypothetical protein